MRNLYSNGRLVKLSDEERITNPQTGGQKGRKEARFDLIPPRALWALAVHYARGSRKYAERNWENGTSFSLNWAAAQRHMWQWWAGEDDDKETGSSHLICAAWHMLALHTFIETHPELDDRPEVKHGG